MAYDVPPPEQCPEPGYYYHYKHDPNGPLKSYAGIVNLGRPWSAPRKASLLTFLKSLSHPRAMVEFHSKDLYVRTSQKEDCSWPR